MRACVRACVREMFRSTLRFFFSRHKVDRISQVRRQGSFIGLLKLKRALNCSDQLLVSMSGPIVGVSRKGRRYALGYLLFIACSIYFLYATSIVLFATQFGGNVFLFFFFACFIAVKSLVCFDLVIGAQLLSALSNCWLL